MGARGKTAEFAKPIQARFTQAQRGQLEILARLDGVSVNALMRRFVREGIQRRMPGITASERKLKRAQNLLDDVASFIQPKPAAREAREKSFVRKYSSDDGLEALALAMGMEKGEISDLDYFNEARAQIEQLLKGIPYVPRAR